MKLESVERGPGSVVWELTNISIGITREESEELRAALAIVQKYEKAALQAVRAKHKYNPAKDADWCEIAYSVKNDKVIVGIRDGMAG